MDAFWASFWAFFNRRSVRLGLAALCFCLFVQGLIHINAAETNAMIFRAGGEVLLWFSWMLANILRAFGKVAPRLNIAVNTGIAMILVSWFLHHPLW